jgi:ParB-like chromosome segregation protein Spo0J
MPQLLPYDEENLQLSLTDLLSLKDAQIPGGAFAMRPLDQAHVQQLAESDQATWPTIQVTRCDAGFIVIDGNHRWAAARLKQAELILASCKTYTDERAVIDTAFRANLTHGLKANMTTRGDYAYWLHVTFPSFPQEKIAERAGLTQGAVSKAIAKRERALQQAQEPVDPREQRRMARRAVVRLTKESERFFNEMAAFPDDELPALLAESLKEPGRTALARLGQLLIEHNLQEETA